MSRLENLQRLKRNSEILRQKFSRLSKLLAASDFRLESHSLELLNFLFFFLEVVRMTASTREFDGGRSYCATGRGSTLPTVPKPISLAHLYTEWVVIYKWTYKENRGSRAERNQSVQISRLWVHDHSGTVQYPGFGIFRVLNTERLVSTACLFEDQKRFVRSGRGARRACRGEPSDTSLCIRREGPPDASSHHRIRVWIRADRIDYGRWADGDNGRIGGPPPRTTMGF